MVRRFIMSWTDWKGREEHVANDLDTILDVIGRLRDECDPPAMLLIWEEGTQRELGVGLGRARTVITYQESADPPYFISAGDPNAKGKEWFCCNHEQTEYLAINLVSSDLIVPTVKAFVQAQARPPTVTWERL